MSNSIRFLILVVLGFNTCLDAADKLWYGSAPVVGAEPEAVRRVVRSQSDDLPGRGGGGGIAYAPRSESAPIEISLADQKKMQKAMQYRHPEFIREKLQEIFDSKSVLPSILEMENSDLINYLEDYLKKNSHREIKKLLIKELIDGLKPIATVWPDESSESDTDTDESDLDFFGFKD